MGEERIDWVALIVLVGLPIGAGVLSWRPLHLTVDRPDPLLAGVALLAAAFLAAFAQLAAWRSRLSERARASEKVARSSIDEAVAHTLLSSITSLLATVVLAVLANVLPDPDAAPAAPAAPVAPGAPVTAAEVLVQVLSSVTIVLGVFLLADFLLIANLLWDAYENANNQSGASSAVIPERRTGTHG